MSKSVDCLVFLIEAASFCDDLAVIPGDLLVLLLLLEAVLFFTSRLIKEESLKIFLDEDF